MRILEKRNIYLKLDEMIRLNVPGDALELSEQLGVSANTFLKSIEEMRGMGAPILYNGNLGHYFYRESGQFLFGFIRYN